MILGIMAAMFVSAPEGLNVRTAPSQNTQIVTTLPFASRVQGTITDGWMETEEGFISCEYLQSENPLDEYRYMGEWLTTAYTHTGQACANGEYPEEGYTVACNILPIGTRLYIKDVGFRTVEDRGPGSMPDAWLDVFMDSYEQCVEYGEQYHGVWIVTE